jgi:hypothetical protein
MVLEAKSRTWTGALVQAVVIVASILMAFGIEAWWAVRQERDHRAALLDDLAAEMIQNRDALRIALERQRVRIGRISELLAELGPDAVGLPGDSVVALQRATLANPTFDPAFGVLDLLIQSGDLAYIEDRALRSRLAGLAAFLDDYLSNQDLLVGLLLQPETVFETGSIIFDHSALSDTDLLLTTARPDVAERAAKYLSVSLGVTDLMIGQGDALVEELEEIMAALGSR